MTGYQRVMLNRIRLSRQWEAFGLKITGMWRLWSDYERYTHVRTRMDLQ